LAKHDLDFDHAPITQYLWHPTPLMPIVYVGLKLVVVATSHESLLFIYSKLIHTSSYFKEEVD
jgi:hypothetical protein